MTVRVYKSTDSSAPVLRGATAGDLIDLLDKCLVSGYGAKTAAGWTKPYTGTDKAVFRQGAGSNNMCLRVDDSNTSSGNRYARVVGYEDMTDVDTGTVDPFPNNTQQSGGLYWHTSYTGTGTARAWCLIADESFFYLFVDTYAESGNPTYYHECFYFGDIVAYKAGDATATIISGNPTASANSSESKPFEGATSLSTTATGLYMARRFDETGGSINAGRHTDYVKSNGSWGGAGLPYPNPGDGGLYMSRGWIHETSSPFYNIRGHIPGCWVPMHPYPFGSFDTFDGTGDMTGKSFFGWRHYNSTQAVETSNTWR